MSPQPDRQGWDREPRISSRWLGQACRSPVWDCRTTSQVYRIPSYLALHSAAQASRRVPVTATRTSRGIHRGEQVVGQPERVHHARTGSLDDHVGPARQLQERLAVRWVLQVERHAPLARFTLRQNALTLLRRRPKERNESPRPTRSTLTTSRRDCQGSAQRAVPRRTRRPLERAHRERWVGFVPTAHHRETTDRPTRRATSMNGVGSRPSRQRATVGLPTRPCRS